VVIKLKKIAFVLISLLSLLILIPGCITILPPTLPSYPQTVQQTPVIVTFDSVPSTGGTQTLEWNVSGATSVSIDNGIGQVALTGSRVITPSSVTTYTLTAVNGSASTSAQTTVNNVAYSPAPATFQVTNVTGSALQPSYTGHCPRTFTFYATITANGPGTITYRWERNDGNWGHIQSMTFSAAGSQSIDLNYDLGETAAGSYKVNVLTPNNIASGPINYSITCTD
jgi:hypothetical protein